ncbi:hypothetical protein ACK8HY_15230 [Sphingobacterium sp. NGMCC 1.201703]|uniref:hypothetical protein n=1 Tax=Sphingobacterium sp. NGMCC 1.201703 TaxID=3388657 RepID=UPI0039FD910C
MMNNDLTALKKVWQTAETDTDKNLKEFHQELRRWRKKKKRAVFFWSISVILFSSISLGYIIYTDELNSISKSISEIIVLLISVYLFSYSWQKINKERKEYLSNSIDFIRTLSAIYWEQKRQELNIFSIGATLFFIAVFLYWLDYLDNSSSLIFSLSTLLILTLTIWLIIKPLLWKRAKIKNQTLSAKIAQVLKHD